PGGNPGTPGPGREPGGRGPHGPDHSGRRPRTGAVSLLTGCPGLVCTGPAEMNEKRWPKPRPLSGPVSAISLSPFRGVREHGSHGRPLTTAASSRPRPSAPPAIFAGTGPDPSRPPNACTSAG